MDRDPASDHGTLEAPPPQQHLDAATTSPAPAGAGTAQQLRDRRREKPLLSCTFCRSRKLRCDRQLPCKTCSDKGIGMSCTYMSGAPRKSKVSVGDRIQQLEALVRSLIQLQQPGQIPQTPAASLKDGFNFKDSPSQQSDDDTGMPPSVSPAPSEPRSIRLHSSGANYFGSVHWAAVLDSISELKDHYEEEEEARMLASGHNSSGPRLLYEPIQATRADILAAIPARPMVDRMVVRYFNAQNSTSLPILHSSHFLRQYENFWQDPASTPFLWLGLLFSIMALAMRSQQLMDDLSDPETLARTHVFREHTIQCLVLGQYTRGGECVLETMLNYITLEMLMCKDAQTGLWLVLGMLVQLALSRGYHRDAQNFSNLSPFAGEMRRRVWAAIVQMDLRLSSQMGLPRILKLHQCDTAEPRNLLDTDFDEATVELPPSRPETEVTPVLFVLAKNRIDRVSNLVSDLLADTKEHLLTEIMELDQKVQEAEASLPPIFRWQPLSLSFMVPPQIIMHRIWLHLSKQRLTIWLHRKYLAPSYTHAQYKYSRNACVQAAIKIVEFQQLVDEETQPDGLLYPVRFMMVTSLGQFVFLLGMSILSYYVQLAMNQPDISPDPETSAKIYNLLHNSYPIWLRSSTTSQEARKAAEHLSLLLGLRQRQDAGVLTEEAAEAVPAAATSHYTTPQDATSSFDLFDPVPWGAYQGFVGNFTPAVPYGTEFPAPAMPGASSVGVSMADLMLTDSTGSDAWMNASFDPFKEVGGVENQP